MPLIILGTKEELKGRYQNRHFILAWFSHSSRGGKNQLRNGTKIITELRVKIIKVSVDMVISSPGALWPGHPAVERVFTIITLTISHISLSIVEQFSYFFSFSLLFCKNLVIYTERTRSDIVVMTRTHETAVSERHKGKWKALICSYNNVSQDVLPLWSQIAAFSCLTQFNVLWNLRKRSSDDQIK